MSGLGQAEMIRAVNLTKRYGTFEAVAGLNLHIRPGEIYGFLGPNGAGKTTTLLMLLGVIQPTAGEIRLFGRPLHQDYFALKRRLGVVGEHQFLYTDLTAHEYLAFFADLYRVPNTARRIGEVLERVGLWEWHDTLTQGFSRGMQQKLALARALLHEPELLILDEPVSGLDPHNLVQVRELLLAENRRGVTILMSSHILSEVERIAHRVGIISGGRLVAEDSMDGLRRWLWPEVRLRVELVELRPEIEAAVADLPSVRAVNTQGHCLVVDLNGVGDARAEVSRAISGQRGVIVGMNAEERDLEQAFLAITEGDVRTLTEQRPRAGRERRPAGTPLASPPKYTTALEEGRSHVSASSPFRGGAAAGIDRCGVSTVLRREARGLLRGAGPYGVLSLAFLVAGLLVRNHLTFITQSGLLVHSGPFDLPLLLGLQLTALFLALLAATTVARERDRGTLEVLFYGPMNTLSFVLGEFLGHMVVYGLLSAGLLVGFLALATLSGFVFSVALVMVILLSVVSASATVTIGLALSAVARTVRTAVVGLLALFGGFTAVGFGYAYLAALPLPGHYYHPLLFLKSTLALLSRLGNALWPLTYLERGMEAALQGQWLLYGRTILASTALGLAMLVAATVLLERRGVRR
ncbi:MAG: ATP-binding cassette domain-containing protein [Armatimonadota bacterium]